MATIKIHIILRHRAISLSVVPRRNYLKNRWYFYDSSLNQSQSEDMRDGFIEQEIPGKRKAAFLA
jgi:hypothetical protein